MHFSAAHVISFRVNMKMDDYNPSFSKYFSFKQPYSETLGVGDVYPVKTETNSF